MVKEYQCWQYLISSTPIGAGPSEWAQDMRNFRRGHEFELTVRPGPGRNFATRARGVNEHFFFWKVGQQPVRLV